MQNISILYVDDDPNLLDLGKTFLTTRWGFSVNTALCANDAISLLKIGSYDVIISDYEMPEIDGISFLKQIRNYNFTEPFILFTGRGREEVVIEALNNGADFYIQKGGNPVSQFSELVNLIKKAVEKNRAEKERDKANSFSYSIIDHLPDPTFVVDNFFNITSWNSALEDMTQIKAEFVIGKNVEDIFKSIYTYNLPILVKKLMYSIPDIEKSKTVNRHFRNVLTAETNIVDRNGRIQIIWAKASPIFDNNMHICGAIETFRDITSIRQKEIEISDTNKKLQNIIDFIPDPTFVIDDKGVVIFWNRALEELTGIKASDIIGKGDYIYSLAFYCEKSPVLIDMIVKDKGEIEKKYMSLIRDKRTVKVESYIPDLNGKKEVYLWGIASPLYDINDNFIGAIESIRDISDIKRLELELKQKYEELASSYEEIAAQNEEIKTSFEETLIKENLLIKSEQKFRSLIENINYGIIILSDDIIDYANQITADILGYSNPRRLIGISAVDIIDPSEKDTLIQLLEINLHNHIQYIESLLIKKNGSRIPVEISKLSVSFNDSRSIMLIMRDISVESKQRSLLNQTKRKLDTLSQITRHDIRNELQIITSIIDVLSDLSLSDPTYHLIEKARISGQKILENLKISDEYQTLGVKDPDWFNINDLIYKAAAWHQMSDKIVCEIDNFEIFADPLINKVFENLIENSLRHGGEINKISIKSMYFSEEILLLYQDDGVGITKDEKNKIFIQGYGKHTGLGLYLIKEILSLTDISIIESGTYGEGALFEIKIPKGKWRCYKEL
jgi:PAS domain S-box-containing protein